MCVVVKRIRSAVTDTRFVEVPKPFSRGNKELFSCYTGGSGGIRPYVLERNVGGCC